MAGLHAHYKSSADHIVRNVAYINLIHESDWLKSKIINLENKSKSNYDYNYAAGYHKMQSIEFDKNYMLKCIGD